MLYSSRFWRFKSENVIWNSYKVVYPFINTKYPKGIDKFAMLIFSNKTDLLPTFSETPSNDKNETSEF